MNANAASATLYCPAARNVATCMTQPPDTFASAALAPAVVTIRSLTMSASGIVIRRVVKPVARPGEAAGRHPGAEDELGGVRRS